MENLLKSPAARSVYAREEFVLFFFLTPPLAGGTDASTSDKYSVSIVIRVTMIMSHLRQNSPVPTLFRLQTMVKYGASSIRM